MIAVLNTPPLLQKVEQGLGVKPVIVLDISPKKAKSELVSAGERRDLAVLFCANVIYKYDVVYTEEDEFTDLAPRQRYLAKRKEKTTKENLDKFFKEVYELIKSDRYAGYERSISSKGEKAVHFGFNTNCYGKFIEMRFLFCSLLCLNFEDFERQNRKISNPISDFWKKWAKKIRKITFDINDRFEEREDFQTLRDTEAHARAILTMI